MRLLEIATADFDARNLRGDRENRHARTVSIKQTVDQMQVARTATAGANGERAGQMSLGAGGKGGGLLVPGMNPFDVAALAQRIGDPIETVAIVFNDPANTG